MTLAPAQTYVRSGNLAAYFGLHPVRSLHLPVPLNLVFVGFQGEGNLEVKFTEDELRKWFGHLDHVLQHTRVDLNGAPIFHHCHAPRSCGHNPCHM